MQQDLPLENKYFRQSTFDVNENLAIRVTLHWRQDMEFLSMGYVPETKRKQFHAMKTEDIFNCATNTIKLGYILEFSDAGIRVGERESYCSLTKIRWNSFLQKS